jgi:hypothetical protein
MVECPYDSAHRLPASSLARHVHKCCLHATGLPPVPLPPQTSPLPPLVYRSLTLSQPQGPNGPSSLFYEGAPGVVQLSDNDDTHGECSSTAVTAKQGSLSTTTSCSAAQSPRVAAGEEQATRGNEARYSCYVASSVPPPHFPLPTPFSPWAKG